jgi:uridine kinase
MNGKPMSAVNQIQQALIALPPLVRTRPRLVAIDGPGAAGKSTLTARPTASGAGAVVHGDDFYTGNTQAGRIWATHFDVERLRSEVLEPARRGERSITYGKYDWAKGKLGDPVSLQVSGLIVVEGVYVAGPPMHDLYDVIVWVDCDRDERLRRGVARDGESMRSTWADVWMPEEDRYRDMCRPDPYAGITVNTAQETS